MEKCGMHLNGNSDYEEYRGKNYKCYEREMELYRIGESLSTFGNI